MKTTTTIRTLGLFAAMGLATAPAWAANAVDPKTATMSPAEIIRAVEGAGYTNIHDLDYDDGRWEMEATSSAGTPVELQVDPGTGKVLHEEAD